MHPTSRRDYPHLGRLGVEHPMLAVTARGGGEALARRVAHLLDADGPRYARLWDYYRNPMTPAPDGHGNAAHRPYRQAQEWGLPPRIVGDAAADLARKEVVVENDIAWRIDAMVDFLFGQPVVLNSAAADPARRAAIERLLRQVLSRNGGIGFLQKLALLGAVYGWVDVLVKFAPPEDDGPAVAPAHAAPAATCDTQLLGDPAPHDTETPAGEQMPGAVVPPPGRPSEPDDGRPPPGLAWADLDRLARHVRFEIVEPARALPVPCPLDPGVAVAYAQVYQTDRPARADGPAEPRPSWLRALFASPGVASHHDVDRSTVVELIAPHAWQRYEDGRLVAEGVNPLGRLPLVHVQNVATPFAYAGRGDVEPLVPLQDELNTRLSDRAYRITMQSFKMYLGKGLEDFTHLPVGPGRMYATDNQEASIVEFGRDAACPSEDRHVDEVREALDKTSGVSPVAAGAVKGRIGRLSSAAALRVTLLALLARTERKRTTYGPAVAQLCDLTLAWLDAAGLFRTTPAERRVELHWPSPIPANAAERLDEAKAKQDLGIDPRQVARELGY